MTAEAVLKGSGFGKAFCFHGTNNHQNHLTVVKKRHSSSSIDAKIYLRAFYPKKWELLTHSEALVMVFQSSPIVQVEKSSVFLPGC